MHNGAKEYSCRLKHVRKFVDCQEVAVHKSFLGHLALPTWLEGASIMASAGTVGLLHFGVVGILAWLTALSQCRNRRYTRRRSTFDLKARHESMASPGALRSHESYVLVETRDARACIVFFVFYFSSWHSFIRKPRSTCTSRILGPSVAHNARFFASQGTKGLRLNIPVSCNSQYIGRTGQCLNARLKEHYRNDKFLQAPCNLAHPCKTCQCSPLWRKTKIVAKSTNTIEREIFKGYTTMSAPEDQCAIVPC